MPQRKGKRFVVFAFHHVRLINIEVLVLRSTDLKSSSNLWHINRLNRLFFTTYAN